jgi:multidrug resistance efflux pump
LVSEFIESVGELVEPVEPLPAIQYQWTRIKAGNPDIFPVGPKVFMNYFRLKTIFPTIIIIAGIFLSGCSNQSIGSISTPDPQIPPTNQPRTLTEARVVPIQSAALSFSMPGIVDEVLVDEDETVQAGGVIARMKGIDRAQAAITQAEMQRLAAQKDMDDFTDKSKIATADAELILAKAQIELINARDARKSLDYQQVTNTTLDGMRAVYIIALDDFKKAEEDYEPYKVRSEKDMERAAFLTRLSNARLAKDKALYNLNKAMEMPDPEKIARADARVSLAEAALDDARLTYDKVKTGPDPAQLTLLVSALKNAEAQAEAAKSGLEDLELIAPFTGKVISNDLKAGQAVSPAVVVMLGDISSWRVETTDLVEMDIVNIHSGDPVTITFDAIPDLKLNGSVNRIKQIGQASKGDITYSVTIDLDQTDPRILWNMKVFVAFDHN